MTLFYSPHTWKSSMRATCTVCLKVSTTEQQENHHLYSSLGLLNWTLGRECHYTLFTYPDSHNEPFRGIVDNFVEVRGARPKSTGANFDHAHLWDHTPLDKWGSIMLIAHGLVYTYNLWMIKTWWCITTDQACLNCCMTLHVHKTLKTRTDSMSLFCAA